MRLDTSFLISERESQNTVCCRSGAELLGKLEKWPNTAQSKPGPLTTATFDTFRRPTYRYLLRALGARLVSPEEFVVGCSFLMDKMK